MKRYQSYKPSGVEWIGKVPSEWSTKRLTYSFKIQKGKIPGELVDEPIFNGLPYLSMDVLRGNEPTEYSDDKNIVEVNKGDIGILWDGSNSGEIIKINRNGILSSTVSLLTIIDKGLNKEFGYYLLKLFENDFKSNTTGMGIPHVNGNYVRETKLIIPPLPEQHQIVQFLDSKTELIDKLISTKERKITLLKEQRTSLINQVVTKGLNPNVKMKDSGVEWIGEIPEHWSFVNFGRICDVRQGLQIRFEERLSEKVENSYEYITTQSVHNPDQYKQYILNPKPNVICNENDILMGRTGNTGEVVTNVNGVFHNNFFLIDFNRKIISKEFLVWYLTNPRLREELLLLSGTTTIPDLNHGKFLSTKFVYPELKEQLQIVEHLNSKTKEIDDLVQLEQKKIDLLKEYRQSLISEVVTGKVKVTK